MGLSGHSKSTIFPSINFINGWLAALLPIHHSGLARPLNLHRLLRPVDVEQLRPKVFVLANNKEHRPLAEYLYRGLVGEAPGVAFKRMPTIFGLTFDKYFSVVPERWTIPDLEAAADRIAQIKRDNPRMNLIVLMVEEINITQRSISEPSINSFCTLSHCK